MKGERWTDHAIELLENFGWKHRGATRVDMPCTVHGKKAHGIDAFLTYRDPYQKKDIGILTETKNYAWENVNASKLQEWVDDLIDKIECVPLSQEFGDKLNFDDARVDTGLLMVWSKGDYDRAKFAEYLDTVKISRKRNSMRIYVMDNYDILKLYSILDTHTKLNHKLQTNEKFDFYYPSYRISDSFRHPNFLSLEYFKSKFIFGRMIKIEKERNGGTHAVTAAVVFYFDKPSLACLDYMHLCLRQFQLTEDEIWIYHYGPVDDFRSPMEEFKRRHTEDGKKIEFRPMHMLKDVPWSVA